MLCLSVPVARTGHQRYACTEGLCDIHGSALPADADGYIDVYKSPEVLFAPDTIDSFNNKPVTIGHTMVEPNNWQYTTVGISTNVRRGEGPLSNNLLADLLITDANAIKLIKDGHTREISLGYNATYESDGEGLAHQTSIVGNHIAIVQAGKAGSFCRIYDSMDAVLEWERRMSLKEKITAAVASCFSDDTNTEVKAAETKDGEQATVAPAAEASTEVGTAEKDTTEVTEPASEAQAETQDMLPPQGMGMQGGMQQSPSQVINEKLDRLLALLEAMGSKTKDADASEQDKEKQQDSNGSAGQTISIDPNKPLR